ncbi:uroporphyrinogen-III synthase [Rhabdochlamydiaceae symbiont of Dictyostelium giganteum]|uniref:uroporphyrinogen-III synthase n=1 Tax=Rhabdochlamydiaceae symbiont of Dictyostelium giganteum TaxID=3342349 RepID=UPI003851341E
MEHVLYLGLDPSGYVKKEGQRKQLCHLPLIQVEKSSLSLRDQCDLSLFTHIIVTSPRSADFLIEENIMEFPLAIMAIGRATAARFLSRGVDVAVTASLESQEGLLPYIQELNPKKVSILYPRSSSARFLIASYLQEKGFNHQVMDLYHVKGITPSHLPSLEAFSEVIFTSPSTVASFFCAYKSIPSHLLLTCIGPITEQVLRAIPHVKMECLIRRF